jgi:hypothetical protein
MPSSIKFQSACARSAGVQSSTTDVGAVSAVKIVPV